MALEDGGFIFGGNTGLTYEQLKQRRAIATALAARQGGFPKTKGEGMTYLGESLAQGLQDLALSRKEAAYNKAVSSGLGSLRAPNSAAIAPVAQTASIPPIAPPVAPPPPPPAMPPPDISTGPDVGPPVADAGGPDVGPPIPPVADVAPPVAPPPTPVAPVSVDPNAAAPLTGGNTATPQDMSMASPRDKIAAAMVGQTPPDQVTLPTQTADIPLPQGNPRTTGGVRATMEAALSRGGQSPTAIAGIERNVRDESGFNPTLRHPDQPKFGGEAHFAHGLYQEGGDEWNNYVKWIDKNAPGSDWRDPNLQSKFLAERLQDPQYANANAGMNAIGATPGQSANAFLKGYLKPAAAPMAQRSAQYLREGGGDTYADRQLAQDGSVSPATPGPRLAAGGGREGGAPVDDTRDLVTQALLEQPQQKPQEQQSEDLLPDVAGMSNRTVLPQRPTASLGRTGVASDTSLPALAPMGALTGAPGPAVPPSAPPAQDPREAITQALLSQQGPGAMDQGAAPAAPPPPPTAMTDIQPAPVGGPGQQVAAGPPPPIPGPLEAPVPRPVPPMQAQPATPPQFAQPPVAPQPPPIPPISQAELRAQALMSQFPDNPVVQQRAQQALADAEKQRLMPYQRDIEKYKSDLGLYNEQYKEWQTRQANQPKEDLAMRSQQQELSDKQAAAARSTRLGGIPESVYAEQIKESTQTVKGLTGATQAIANARSALDDKMFTGSLANRELQIRKFLAAVGFQPEDPRIAPTEAFKSYMASVTAQARSALVGNAQISNADLNAAKEASGGNITLEASSIRKTLDSLERINTASAIAHQGKLLSYAGDDPNAQRSVFGVFGLPMERVIPPAFVERLRARPELAGEFDRTFNTPGLAQRILQQR